MVRENSQGPQGGFLESEKFKVTYKVSGASLVAQMVRSLPEMGETWVQSLSQKDPLEKGMPNRSSIFACRIPWTEKPAGLQSMGSQRVGHG